MNKLLLYSETFGPKIYFFPSDYQIKYFMAPQSYCGLQALCLSVYWISGP